ncbi:LOW QUALITY PROTEIN: hypothetical protein MAR_021479, partial [Mya arenaria]
RRFAPIKYEKHYQWLYYSTIKNGYMCKNCELFGTLSVQDKAFVKKLTSDQKTGVPPKQQVPQVFRTKVCLSKKSSTNVYWQLNMKMPKWAVTENAEMFIRFVANLSNVETFFIGFVQLTKGTAECRPLKFSCWGRKLILQTLDSLDLLDVIQCVQRMVRHASPFSVYINCRNHRLALCQAHLIKRFPLMQDVDATLPSLRTVYGKDPLIITRAAATLWLSHLQASARLISMYVCIPDTLDAVYAEKREPEIQGIRQNVTDKNIVPTVLLLCDILKPVNMLSLYLKKENVNFTSLPVHVRNTIDSLSSLVAVYRDETEFARYDELFSEIDERTDLNRRIRQNNQRLTSDASLEET